MPLARFPAFSARPAGRRQEWLVAGGVAAAFALYLFTSEYHHLYYDAADYWQLGHRFYQAGRFQLLAYDDALRGYSYPLLNFACLALRKVLRCEAVPVVKAVNAGLAGLLFGVVGPRLWRRATGAAALPGVGRRLLFAGLGFVFWRGYFNFSLSDFPALLALGTALWQAQRPGRWAAGWAGAALALALNVRPIYLAAVLPAVLLLELDVARRQWLPRLLAMLLGAAVVLAPQWLLNRRHFGADTPLVLAESRALHIHHLYLQKLFYGLQHEKYETSVGRGMPTGQLLFLDAAGAAVLRTEAVAAFKTPGQYLRVVSRHPLVVAGVYARHLFAGLDISHPTPYLHRWQPAGWLRGLNYGLWCVAALVALARRPTRREALVLAGLLLPCLAVLPMSMEARFLLPLHLLLLALVAFGRWPRWAFRGWRAAGTLGLGAAALLGCARLSSHIQHMVEPRFRPYVLPAGPRAAAPLSGNGGLPAVARTLR